ncbi:MAG: VIT and VWA domain-containing protein [Pseudomonadota bacterium]
MKLRTLPVAFAMMVVAVIRPVHAATFEDLGGHVVATQDGQTHLLPMLESDIDVRIQGDMATVAITQTFINDAQTPMQAEYLFPLNQKAAVYSMEMVVGDENVTAVIKEKAQAEAAFENAAAEGKAAAVLTQHRPNMFTQKIANLMPGLPIKITLRYVQMVPKIDGKHELVIPLVVGPRYVGASAVDTFTPARDDVTAPLQRNAWTISDVPAHPPVYGLDLPDTFGTERLSFNLEIVTGAPLTNFDSATHPLSIERNDFGLSAKFEEGRVMDNKDLVVRYALQGETLQATSLSHTDERGGFVALMVEPPTVPDETVTAPRELVFVIDTSGSMSGAPMRASKRFMDTALRGLRANDYFRIIPFANTAQSFSKNALVASPANIHSGRGFVDQLSTGGGTEIDNAIRAAFATQQPSDALRIVVFLSDGYVGDEAQVLATINRQIGDARIYAFGVGSSVNRYLLDAMADGGRGYARYVPIGADPNEIAETLAADLKSPLLTDIRIDWGDLDVSEVVPAKIPDLFAGQGLRIYARHNGTAKTAQITVKGLVQGHPAQMPVDILLTNDGDAAALPLIWARNKIAVLNREVALSQNPSLADAEITRLGLEFALQTKNTAFVAVSKARVNTTGKVARPAQVALPIPSGVPKTAFSGASTPEPQAIIGFLIVAAASLVGLRRRFE